MTMAERGAGSTMRWAIVDRIAILVHGSGTPSNDEWQAWLREYQQRKAEFQGLLIYSLGGGPSSAQRTELREVVETLEHVPQTVIVTSSAIVRGIVTALTWFISQRNRAKLFAPAKLEDAFAALGLTEAERRRAYKRILNLAEQVTRPAGAIPPRPDGPDAGSATGP
jgi:hypothetical protein